MGCDAPWLDRLRRVLTPGMKALDVGAHLGVYAFTMAEAVAPTGCVVAVEPSAPVAARLREQVATSPWAPVITVREVAVADQPGRRVLYHHGTDSRQASLASENVYPDSPGNAGTSEVEVVTLDALLAEPPLLGHVDVVKLDTQGAEGLILRGAQRLLALPHVRVQLELWPEGLARLGSSPNDLCDLMQAAGFTPCGADEVPYSYPRLLEIAEARGAKHRYINLAFVK